MNWLLYIAGLCLLIAAIVINSMPDREDEAYKGVPLSVGNYNPQVKTISGEELQPARKMTQQEFKQFIEEQNNAD